MCPNLGRLLSLYRDEFRRRHTWKGDHQLQTASYSQCSGLVAQSCLTLCDPRDWPTRCLCPWDSPGKNTGVGCRFLLQGIFPAQGLNPGLLQCRQIICCLSHQGSPPTSIQTGNCHRPLHILNHELLQLLTFNTP